MSPTSSNSQNGFNRSTWLIKARHARACLREALPESVAASGELDALDIDGLRLFVGTVVRHLEDLESLGCADRFRRERPIDPVWQDPTTVFDKDE